MINMEDKNMRQIAETEMPPHKWHKKNKIFALGTAMMFIFVSVSSVFVDAFMLGFDVYASTITPSPTPKSSPTPTPTEEEKKAMENIMKGLSSFETKPYEWSGSVNVGTLAYSIAESLYTMRNSESKETLYWNKDSLTEEMKDFYSSTNWNKFEGMYETIELANYCQAVLTDEVKQYEELLDAAATKYGFAPYKEIFKAIAQTRFNEYKDDYEAAKSAGGYTEGDGSFKFDLFHINGSWLAKKENGDKTPVGEAAAPTATPMPTPIPPTYISGTPIPAPPTPWPETDTESPQQRRWHRDNGSCYTVADSIDIAAQAFAGIIEDACYPSPYSTDSLMSAVQGFEYGGNSEEIKKQYVSSSIKLNGYNKFVTFTYYLDQSVSEAKANDGEEADIDYDKFIGNYAKVIAHGKTRADKGKYGDKEYGEYKYSDQYFYQKVFENYKCSGGGTIDYGELPEDMKEILRKCMQTWDSRVTKERKEIIQQGILLYGVTYSMDARNTPSYDAPKYLDCSSFVGQCYWRSKVATEGQSAADWTTPTVSGTFTEINESQLIPGDVGQKCWPGNAGGSDHVGIYIGSVDGTKYWLHCTGGYTDGVYHAPGKGIKINNYSGFQHYGRYPGL